MKKISIALFCLVVTMPVNLFLVQTARGQQKSLSLRNHSVLDVANVSLWISPDTWLDKGTWPALTGEDHIYDGGLWVSDGQKVMAWDQWFSDDWEETQEREEMDDATGKSVTFYINDATAGNSIGLSVVLHAYQWKADDRKDFIIIEYEITNTSGADIPDLYVAQHVDPDITAQTNIDNDRAAFDDDANVLYAFDAPGGVPGHLGITVAGSPVGTVPHTAAAWRIGPEDPFDEAAQLALMTGGIDPALTSPTPVPEGDYRIVLTAQPFDLPAGAMRRVAFGLVLGGSPAALADGTTLLRTVYDAEVVATEGFDEIVRSFTLGQNYPNPFNPTTTIPFALSEPSSVSLRVFDVQGNVVATLVQGTYSPGSHEATFDATGLPSGVYFYRLEVNGEARMKPLMLLK